MYTSWIHKNCSKEIIIENIDNLSELIATATNIQIWSKFEDFMESRFERKLVRVYPIKIIFKGDYYRRKLRGISANSFGLIARSECKAR